MKTLDYILKKFNISYNPAMPTPIEIPNYGRDNLASLFNELGFTRGAEIGVETGAYSETLLKSNPGLRLYSIDPWKVYPDFRDYKIQKYLDARYNEAKTRLASYNCEIVRKFSQDAVADFADGSLDFVYIDGNHKSEYVIADLIEWSKKVRIGGIVSGHDYTNHVRHRIKYDIIEYTNAQTVKPWFVLGSYKEIPGEIRDNSRSWMWVKE